MKLFFGPILGVTIWTLPFQSVTELCVSVNTFPDYYAATVKCESLKFFPEVFQSPRVQHRVKHTVYIEQYSQPQPEQPGAGCFLSSHVIENEYYSRKHQNHEQTNHKCDRNGDLAIDLPLLLKLWINFTTTENMFQCCLHALMMTNNFSTSLITTKFSMWWIS